MPDQPATPQSITTQPESLSSEPQLGLEDSTPPARGLHSSGLRFGDDEPVPDWARGKTARELLEITQQIVSNIGMPQQPAPAPAPQTPAPTPMNMPPQPPDPDLIYTDKAEYNRQLAAYLQNTQLATLQQYSAPFTNNAADTAIHLSKQGRFADVWKRWEPEVMAELASVPRSYWNITLLDKAAQIVRSNHLDEIVQEQAERLAADRGAPITEGSGPGSQPSSPAVLPLDILFEENHPSIKRFRDAGLSAGDVRAMLPRMKTTEEEYVTNLKSSHIVSTGRFTQVEAGAYK